MDTLKKLFPLSFQKNDSGKNFAIGLIVYVAVAIIMGLLIGLAQLLVGWIPVAGPALCWVLYVIGVIVEIYVVAGIVLKILTFTKVIK